MFKKSIGASQLLLLMFVVSLIESQQANVLEPRIAVERELAAGLKHEYPMTLNKDEYVKVTVTQNGIDVIGRIIDGNGKIIEEFDTELRLNGKETFELIAEDTGNYVFRIETKNQDKDGVDAGRYEIRLVEKRNATDTDRSLQEGRRLTAEANRELGAGNPETACPLAARALVIQEEAFGKDDAGAIPILNILGNCAYQTNDYDGAFTNFQRALTLGETNLPPDHPYIADSLAGLAITNFVKGKYSDVEPLCLRAIEIKERAFGPDHAEVARSLLRLGNIYFHVSDFVQAELVYRRVLKIAEKSMGENDLTFVRALANLANVYVALGDFEKAEPMFIRSLAWAEKTYGRESPKLGAVLIQMGTLYIESGNYAKAEAHLQRVLKIVGNGSDAVVPMNNLANLYSRQGLYEKAKPLYEDSLAKGEALYGKEHKHVAYTLIELAHLHRALGDLTQAEELYHRGLAIYEKLMGPDHPELGGALKGMAILCRLKGDVAQSVEFQTRANAISERTIHYNLVVGGERQKLAYLASVSEQTDRTISLHIQSAPDNPRAKELAATAVLQRKGRVLDWMADRLAALRERSSPDDQLQIQKLNEVSSQLANLVLGGKKNLPLAIYRQKVKALEEQREGLESEISRRSEGFYQHSDPVTLQAVQEKIPQDAALIEFTIYRPFDPRIKNPQESFGEPRLVAYVLKKQKEVQWKDLGTLKSINNAIKKFRQALRDPGLAAIDSNHTAVKVAGRNVDRLIMEPLRPFIRGVRQLLISPDGALNFVPFEALVDERNRYLIQQHSSTYLTSGRDLLRMLTPRESKTRTLVFANPAFGEAVGIDYGRIQNAKTPEYTARRQSITIGSDMSDIYFPALLGTALEAQAIGSLFKNSEVLMGEDATESYLKKSAAPRILHIATHGFFLNAETGSMKAKSTRSIDASAKPENPLLRSGLALAGANLHKKGTDDGILTAMEASGLNLWGTKLVTLSACDTGLGEVRMGEGVYGLRRAFLLAGAETVMMSLWPVSDSVTTDLMSAYYKNLKKGLGRRDAFREVQLGMIGQAEQSHPYYWASFIVTGEWGKL